MNRPNIENYRFNEVRRYDSQLNHPKYEADLEAYCNFLEGELSKKKWLKMLPCKCGWSGKKRHLNKRELGFDGWGIECPKCGFKVFKESAPYIGDKKMAMMWNEAVAKDE